MPLTTKNLDSEKIQVKVSLCQIGYAAVRLILKI